jgi:hypothetical protein
MHTLRVSPGVTRWLRHQQLFVVLGVLIYAMFSVLRIPVSLVGALMGSLLCGNFTLFLVQRFQFLFSKVKPPYNWLAFTLVLGLITPVSVTASIWIVGWVLFPQALHWKYVRSFWEFSFICTVVLGLVFYGYAITKERLERRNRELEQDLNRGRVRLCYRA